MQIADIWLRDLPQQFQGKRNIEVLIKAFSKQMQDLEKVFLDLNTMTDIDTATGQNLDYVGSIIPLTRKEAGELAGIGVTDPVISDDRYRQFLRYQNLVNTNECTYYDIMMSIEILWDVERAFYYERPDRPATIFIGLPLAGVDDEDPAEGRPTIMKPGGVGFIYAANYAICIEHLDFEGFALRKIIVVLDMHFFVMEICDGTAQYDAKRKYQLDAGMRLCLEVRKYKEDVNNVVVETRRNVQYYNGKKRYDATMKYNALLRKDVIE